LHVEKEVSTSFCEQKEAKKLCSWGLAPVLPTPPGAKVFWFFFSKKNRFTFS
jgi:hypothetical protein